MKRQSIRELGQSARPRLPPQDKRGASLSVPKTCSEGQGQCLGRAARGVWGVRLLGGWVRAAEGAWKREWGRGGPSLVSVRGLRADCGRPPRPPPCSPLTFCPGEMRALTCFSTGFRELS